MNTDPTTLAREVVRQHGHLDRDALSRREKERLDLARAVLRVERLADELDREASEHMERHIYSRSGTRIRAALNGGHRG